MALAQPPDIAWTGIYHGGYPTSFAVTPDYGYVVGGWTNWTYDGYILKIDSAGEFEWHGAPGATEVWDLFLDTRPVPENGYISVGYRYGYPQHFDFATLVVRTDEFGDTLWTREYNLEEHNDILTKVLPLDNGDFLCVGQIGQVGPNSNGGDVLIMRLDALGDTVWTRSYGTTWPDIALGISEVSENRYIIVGEAGDQDSHLSDWTSVYALMITGTGDTLWTRTYTVELQPYIGDCLVDSIGRYLFVGTTRNATEGHWNVFALLVDSTGQEIWQRVYRTEFNRIGVQAALAPQSGYILFGGAWPDYFLMRIDVTGDTVWTRTYGNDNDNHLVGGAVLSDGSYMMCGFRSGGSADSTGVYLVRTYPEGEGAGEYDHPAVADNFSLSVFPNPFNASTTIEYTLATTSTIELRLYDLLGRQVQMLLQERQLPGDHRILFAGNHLPSGVYFAALETDDEVMTVKLLLLR